MYDILDKYIQTLTIKLQQLVGFTLSVAREFKKKATVDNERLRLALC